MVSCLAYQEDLPDVNTASPRRSDLGETPTDPFSPGRSLRPMVFFVSGASRPADQNGRIVAGYDTPGLSRPIVTSHDTERLRR